MADDALPPSWQAPPFAWDAALAAAAQAGDQRPTWAYTWPAGQRLASVLPSLVTLTGRRVVDLGCGKGLLGLWALEHGATVLFADASPHPLAWIEALLAANPQHAPRARTAIHRWGAVLPGGPWELILGGDILYRPECHAALMTTIAISLHPHGQALLADPRSGLEEDLPHLAAAAGLTMHSQRHAAGFTLLRLEREEMAGADGAAPAF